MKRPPTVKIVLAAMALVPATWGLILNHTGGPRAEVAWLLGILSGIVLSLGVVTVFQPTPPSSNDGSTGPDRDHS